MTNDELKKIAAANPPPQEWFDDKTDPFAPMANERGRPRAGGSGEGEPMPMIALPWVLLWRTTFGCIGISAVYVDKETGKEAKIVLPNWWTTKVTP